MTPWMIAITSVGHEPEVWLESFCDEFQISPELAPPGVICAKLRDHFESFARNQWVKTEAGKTVKLEAYLPGSEPEANEACPEDVEETGEEAELMPSPGDIDCSVTAAVPPPAPQRRTGNKIDAVARLRGLQAKHRAEMGKTPGNSELEPTGSESLGNQGTAA